MLPFPVLPMRAALLALPLLVLGCTSNRLPPVPDGASMVILASDHPTDRLFALATGAFLEAGWEVVETRDFRFLVRPDGTDALVEVTVADALPGEGRSRLVAVVGSEPTLVRRTARVVRAVEGTLSYR